MINEENGEVNMPVNAKSHATEITQSNSSTKEQPTLNVIPRSPEICFTVALLSIFRPS